MSLKLALIIRSGVWDCIVYHKGILVLLSPAWGSGFRGTWRVGGLSNWLF